MRAWSSKIRRGSSSFLTRANGGFRPATELRDWSEGVTLCGGNGSCPTVWAGDEEILVQGVAIAPPPGAAPGEAVVSISPELFRKAARQLGM